jgi:hypothetical protein
MGRGAVGDSIDKVGSISGFGAEVEGLGFLLSAHYGDEDRMDFDALGCWDLDLQHGSDEASPGSACTTTLPRLLPLMVKGRRSHLVIVIYFYEGEKNKLPC